MKIKTILIVIGIVILLIIFGRFAFPFVLGLFKSLIGLMVIILVTAGISVGILIGRISKKKKK